jgi:hypothetical protein
MKTTKVEHHGTSEIVLAVDLSTLMQWRSATTA